MKYAIPSLAILLFFSSCSNNSKSEMVVFNAAEEGFSNANKRITWQTDILYKSLENKLAEPATHEQAFIWQPKAEYIHQLSSDMVKYIEGLKNDLIKEAGFKTENGKEILREDDMGAVARIFSEKKMGKELSAKLVKYKNDMLAVDSGMKIVFENNIILVTKSYDSDSALQKDLTKYFFYNIPLIAAMAMLSKIENNVKAIESDFVMYCNSRVANDFPGYDRFSPIFTLSSSCIRGGEEVEINAGIGAFTTAAAPRVTINGISIPVNENGLAIYRFKGSLKAGKYSMPVKIQYTNTNGIKETVEKKVEYTVIEEK